jgi:ribonuclease P protein component
VAGKKVGNAVKRNQAKRLLRAHFLALIDHLSPGQYVLVAKAPLIGEKHLVVSEAFMLALKRAKAYPNPTA